MSPLPLASLMSILAAAEVRVVAAPVGLDVTINGARIFDPDNAGLIAADEVVLGVNVTGERLAALLDAACRARAGAVLVRETTASEASLRELAATHQVAVLAVSPRATWDQLLVTIRNAASSEPAAPGEANRQMRDLFAVADAVAALAAAAVTIEDRHSNLLAYSTLEQPIDSPRTETILGRRLPDRWERVLRARGFFDELLAVPPRVVRIWDPELPATKPRLATTIRAGDELLGFLWAVEGDTPLADGAETALIEGARLAALHLLRHQAADDLSRRERGNLLREFLDGARDISDVSSALAIPADSQCAVVAFRLMIDDDVDLSVKRSRVLDLITLTCESFRRRVVLTAVGDTVHALFPAVDTSSQRQLATLVHTMVNQLNATVGENLVVGIGGVVDGLAQAATSRSEADKAVRVLLAGADRCTRVATFDDVRTESILQSLGDFLSARDDLRLPALDAIIEYDRQHGKTYLATLQTFVAVALDIPAAARALGVHPNSVRYRLRRIEEISGLDLRDARHVLVAGLHLLSPHSHL